MLERADARLWFSMIAIASAVPAVVFVISAIWFMRFYFAPPTILAAAPLGPSALAQVEVAVPPSPAAEPVAPLLAAQTPKPLSTMPMLGDAHPAYSDPAQDISTVVSPVMPAKPAAVEPSEPIAGPVPPVLAQAEAPAPQMRHQPTEMAEVVAALPDAKASELASAPPAVAPPMLGDAHPAYSDPAQDISTVVSPVMPAKPAAVEPSEPIEGPIPLPRPQPRVTVAHVSRTVPLARSPTVASSPRPTSRH
jgi:hypothetical protein